MKLLSTTLTLISTLLFSACGENTTTPQVTDIQMINIVSNNITKIYSTQAMTQINATVTYKDATTADATTSVEWSSSDTNVSTVSNGEIYPGVGNGGTADITISYKKFSDSISIEVVKLTDFNISHSDINSTGSYELQAMGKFEDNTSQVITRNISWSATNDAVISFENDIYSIAIIAGETNVTAAVFDETNASAAILAPKTVTYSIN